MKIELSHNKIQAKQGLFNKDLTEEIVSHLKASVLMQEQLEESGSDLIFNIESATQDIPLGKSGISSIQSEGGSRHDNSQSVKFVYMRAAQPTLMSINTLRDKQTTDKDSLVTVHMPRLEIEFGISLKKDGTKLLSSLNRLDVTQYTEYNGYCRFGSLENFFSGSHYNGGVNMNSCYGDNMRHINALADPELFTKMLFSSPGNDDLSQQVLTRSYDADGSRFLSQFSVARNHHQSIQSPENTNMIYSLYEKYKDCDDLMLENLSDICDITYSYFVTIIKELYDADTLDIGYLWTEINPRFMNCLLENNIMRRNILVDNVAVIMHALIYELLPESDKLAQLFDIEFEN